MKYPHLKGKRYVRLVRCSTIGQADTSIEDQFTVISAFASEHEMTCAGSIQLDGVSGSVPGNRTDIDEVIERKRVPDDFDVLLVQDTTRLTRSGALHGSKIEYDLAAAGIEVVFIADNLPEGDFAAPFKSILYEAGKQHAKSISWNVSRGAMSALLQRRTTYCPAPPFGIDKLYVLPDGTPSHIIRWLPDGTQLKLDPSDRTVIMRFGRDSTGKIPRHYRKQKDERVVLIPGADEDVAMVRRIFARHYLEGWGYRHIAIELNSERIPTPRGKAWSPTTVRCILLNPIYLGRGIANRLSGGVYHRRAANAPERVERKLQTLATSKTPPRQIRPRTDWQVCDEPQLAEFLDDPRVRELARRKQDATLEAQSVGRVPAFSRDRHAQSKYILKGVLRSKQGGHPMAGRTTGGKYLARYYAVTAAIASPGPDRTLRRLIPAEPLEKAVLGILRTVLLAPEVQPQVLRAVKCCRRAITGSKSELPRLRKRRDAVVKRIEFALEQLDAIGREALKEKMQQLQSELLVLEEQIRQAQTASPLQEVKPETAAQRATEELKRLGESLDNLPAPSLRRVLETLVEGAVVDLETRDFELSLRVPSWAVERLGTMCVDASLVRSTEIDAHPECGIVLVRMRFAWSGQSREFVAQTPPGPLVRKQAA